MNKKGVKMEKKCKDRADEIQQEYKKVTISNNYLKENRQLKIQIKEKEENIKKLLEEYKYLQANIENLKKRHQKDILDVRDYSIKHFAKKILSIMDSIEQGLEHINNDRTIDVKTVEEGLYMSNKIFLSVLKEFNIIPMESNDNKFDPEKHLFDISLKCAEKMSDQKT